MRCIDAHIGPRRFLFAKLVDRVSEFRGEIYVAKKHQFFKITVGECPKTRLMAPGRLN